MENREVARVLRETAQLLEIDGAIIGRYRSYEKAAELIASLAESIEVMARDPEKLEELPGIGERMAEHIREILSTGDYALRKKLLKKYPLTMLELLTLQSLGPKKALILWREFKCCTVEQLEQLAREGKLRDLAGFGEKTEQNILKAIEVYKKISGRFLIPIAEHETAKLIAYIQRYGKPIASITPAGSLRRWKETIGDLDLLLTLAPETQPKELEAIKEHILGYGELEQVLARGENKVSFRVAKGLQVDVRLLQPENYGAALIYFTGSKEHNVSLRGREYSPLCRLNLGAAVHVRALAHGEAIPLRVKGPRGALRLVVARRQGLHRGEARDTDRRDASLRSAGDHHLRIAAFDDLSGRQVAIGLGLGDRIFIDRLAKIGQIVGSDALVFVTLFGIAAD